MIIIGIDISLSSTAVTINKFDEEFILCYLNDNKTDKWANMLDSVRNIKILRLETNSYNKDYSCREVQKLLRYEYISNQIITDIYNICGDLSCDIRIEGYSYTKNTNSIIDIITLSTLIRLNLLNKLNCNITVISPSTLKLETCRYCYGISEIEKFNKDGKKLKSEFKCVNEFGVSGGRFTKFEIYKAILYKKENSIMYNFLDDNRQVLEFKKIPSPIDDINDSLMLTKINIK